LALHLGEVLYGNVGAVDRLDFTVIGPAVNEAARIEVLCEPLGRNVLVSAEFAAAVGDSGRLVPLGRHTLRGVREMQEIYGLDLASCNRASPSKGHQASDFKIRQMQAVRLVSMMQMACVRSPAH
jgi:class 3 adenylate cyclase